MATKKKSRKTKRARKGRPPGDSPILVGGGGGFDPAVELSFDHDDYVPDPDNRDNFVHPELVLDYLLLNHSNRISLEPDSSVIIRYKRGGATDEIIVTADPNDDVPLGVEFNPKKLKYNYQSKKHRADGLILTELEIDEESTDLTDDAEIEIHTK